MSIFLETFGPEREYLHTEKGLIFLLGLETWGKPCILKWVLYLRSDEFQPVL